MSSGYGEGENRVSAAIKDALHSPLLNSNDIFNSKKVLLSISFCAENEGDTLMMEEMNEVHDFMDKFRDDVETKWGLSVDPSLGKKVKITILATGFGITNVPGMQEKLDTEEKTRREQLEEAAEENEERRGRFYGNSDKISGSKKRPKVYLFELNDLDNDEIVSTVEMIPTYKRTKEQLNDIKMNATKDVAIEPEISATPTITF
jgi:cell division protein FtsZ